MFISEGQTGMDAANADVIPRVYYSQTESVFISRDWPAPCELCEVAHGPGGPGFAPGDRTAPGGGSMTSPTIYVEPVLI